MTYSEDELLQLSGIQHFAFCRRQWALIHIENQWEENYRTVDGALMHDKAHDADFRESRVDTIITRAVSVYCAQLGVSGQCDVVEYHRAAQGIAMKDRDGLWQPYPVEYKRGASKQTDADRLQLCAQAMCLENMLCCDIPEGALYYGQTRRRERVEFTDELRAQVRKMLEEMHELYARSHTPRVKSTKSCNACSLKELCLPRICKKTSARAYLSAYMEQEP